MIKLEKTGVLSNNNDLKVVKERDYAKTYGKNDGGQESIGVGTSKNFE